MSQLKFDSAIKCAFIFILPLLFASASSGQSLQYNKLAESHSQFSLSPEQIIESPFVGKWSYRSYRNDSDLSAEPNDLLFGAATIQLQQSAFDRLEGTIGGEGWELRLTGSVTYGNPATFRLQGKGVVGNVPWIYDYVGYLVPIWPNGESQHPAIVGSVIRTIQHGDAKAGYVASFIAVRQN